MSAPEEITVTTCLAFLYVAFAHLTDGDLSEEEQEKIQEKLLEWNPDVIEVLMGMLEGAQWYFGSIDDNTVVDQLGAIADALGGSGVDTSAILDDLKEIAEADGKFDDDEKAMIAGLEKLWA